MPTFTIAGDSPFAASRIWLAVKDSSKIGPKLAPHAIGSVEHVDSPTYSVGSIRLIKFGTGAPAGAYVKDKVIALDEAARTLTAEEIEGGHLVKGFTKWIVTIKITHVNDNSSKWKYTVDYEGENEAAIAHDKEEVTKLFVEVGRHINKTGAYA